MSDRRFCRLGQAFPSCRMSRSRQPSALMLVIAATRPRSPAASDQSGRGSGYTHSATPPCVKFRGLLPFAAFSAGRTRDRHILFSRSHPCETRPCRSTQTSRSRIASAGWIAAALLVCIAAAGGCSNIASQAANVEGVRLYQQGNYQQASDRFQQAIAQDPKSPEGYYNLAAVAAQNGHALQPPERSAAGRESVQPVPGARSEPRRVLPRPGRAAQRNGPATGSVQAAEPLGQRRARSRPTRRSSSPGCWKKSANPSKPKRNWSTR